MRSQAARHMELYGSRIEDDEFVEEQFSDNVLLIEITGPSFHTFSVVDLPALMHCKLDDFPPNLRQSVLSSNLYRYAERALYARDRCCESSRHGLYE